MGRRQGILSIVWAGLLAFTVMGPPTPAEGKSVFAVASHASSAIKAYAIEPDGVSYLGTFLNTQSFGVGATGLCVWPSVQRLFVTYEGSATIAWMSTKRLEWDPSHRVDIPESNLAGLVADESKGLLYVVSRNTGHLFTLRFDAVADRLVMEYPGGQAYRVLAGLGNPAYGLALDDRAGWLFAADGSSIVRYYDTTTWDLVGQVDVGRGAVGIDVDGAGYLYAGCFPAGGGHTYLVRCLVTGDPNDPETRIEKNLGVVVTDIGIDRETGLLYATTRRTVNGRLGAVEVYDPTGWTAADPNGTLVLLDIESDADFYGPAGIGVGSQYKPSDRLVISKSDDVGAQECVGPGETITYTIRYYALADANHVTITDTFDPGVDYPFFDWETMTADPNYDPAARTYTWDLGFLPGWDPHVPGDPNETLTVSVTVNERAEPGGMLVNRVAIESDTAYAEARLETPVCCWGGDVIFVDPNAVPGGYGTSWANAYTNLQDALVRARRGCGSTIWVKRGTYRPGHDTSATFEIPPGVAVYGGFAGDEDPATFDLDDRDLQRNRTVLSGLVGEDEWGRPIRAETVVTMADDAILDGVTVEGALYDGIAGSGVSFSVRHSRIWKNEQRGVSCTNGNMTIEWTTIEDNRHEGIYHEGSGYTATVRNCVIRENQRHGLRTNESVLELTGSLIYANGVGGNYHGVSIGLPSASGVIRNCTIVDQPHYGLDYAGSNPPDIRNCIFWNNNTEGDGESLRGYRQTYYCCVQDPNDPQGTSTPDAYGNITCDPAFAYDQPPHGFYHLDADSPCRDMGDDTYIEYGQVDIDGDGRISGLHADIGADEIACEDTSDSLDWTADGVINLEEFATLSAAWRTHDPNDPVCDPNHPGHVSDPNAPGYIDPASFANWNATCDFDADFDVDLDDLLGWVQNGSWLWQACWRGERIGMMRSAGGEPTTALAAPGPVSLVAEPSRVPGEKPLFERMRQGARIAVFLERLRRNHPEIEEAVDKDDWARFVGDVYEWLYELRTEYDNVFIGDINKEAAP